MLNSASSTLPSNGATAKSAWAIIANEILPSHQDVIFYPVLTSFTTAAELEMDHSQTPHSNLLALSRRRQDLHAYSAQIVTWSILRNLWDPVSNPSGYVSLGIAENILVYQKLSTRIHGIHSSMGPPSRQTFTYGDGPQGSTRLRRAMSLFLTKWLEPCVPIEYSHISITNGCSSAIEHLSWILADPGDAVLLGRPYYGTFVPGIQLRPGVKVLDVGFGKDVDPMSVRIINAYEEKIAEARCKGQKVKALVLCNPHDPLGRCYRREVLTELLKMCQRHRVHFISDEIYAFSVRNNIIDDPNHDLTCPKPVPFNSVLSINTTGIIDSARVHCLWGLSKDFGANGLRIGAIISQANPELHCALTATALYSFASSLSDFVGANILEDDAWTEEYINENRRELSQRLRVSIQKSKT